MADDEEFPERELAASVASKVFYYLEEYEEALRLALESGHHFDLSENSLYVETLIHKCIDSYIEKRVLLVDKKEENTKIDPKMEEVIDRMFSKCYFDQTFKQAIGVAVESRRLDKLREAIEKSNNVEDNLSYAFSVA